MSYLLAALLALILFLMLRGKRKLDRVHALLERLERDHSVKKRQEEVESLLKQFATK